MAHVYKRRRYHTVSSNSKVRHQPPRLPKFAKNVNGTSQKASVGQHNIYVEFTKDGKFLSYSVSIDTPKAVVDAITFWLQYMSESMPLQEYMSETFNPKDFE